RFQAKASDPDGDDVSIVFRLDGKQVASGTSYDFSASQPGSHELDVVASDEGGQEARVRRHIEVAGRPEDPTTTGVQRALARYASCLEKKDEKCLRDVWILADNSLYLRRWRSQFKRSDPLEVSIDLESLEKRGNQVTVIFAQNESWSSQAPKSYTYKAVLVERKSTKDWQMIDNQLFGN
ncbi:MAG: hypothetical protein L0206_08380, partial [Actinobacteria bacterium]|nr:hypothetical protein [Actinomycetota bacterium]